MMSWNRYGLKWLAVAIPATTTGWLLFLLRYSAAPETLISRHSWAIILEVLGVNILGVLLVAWCWNFSPVEGRRRLKWIGARCTLWASLSAWIPVAFMKDVAAMSQSMDATRTDFQLMRTLVPVSLLLSLAGYYVEMRYFRRFRDHQCSSVVVGIPALILACVLFGCNMLLMDLV
jgi:hypothetical protein